MADLLSWTAAPPGPVTFATGITRSTRYGCSVLLFAIFLEPLAALIRAESRIKGLIGGGREHKLFLYADNILVLSWDPTSSVSVLLEIIEAYSKVSGYCINWHKSEAMPVSQSCSCSQLSAFNLKWLPKGMKYLGIELDLDIREMTTNIEKVLDKI